MNDGVPKKASVGDVGRIFPSYRLLVILKDQGTGNKLTKSDRYKKG